jgi:hypothetical protein
LWLVCSLVRSSWVHSLSLYVSFLSLLIILSIIFWIQWLIFLPLHYCLVFSCEVSFWGSAVAWCFMFLC